LGAAPSTKVGGALVVYGECLLEHLSGTRRASEGRGGASSDYAERREGRLPKASNRHR